MKNSKKWGLLISQIPVLHVYTIKTPLIGRISIKTVFSWSQKPSYQRSSCTHYSRNHQATVYILRQYTLSFSNMQWYTKVHLFSLWLVWGRNQVYCTWCSAKMAHKQIALVIAKYEKGAKSLLSYRVYHIEMEETKWL